MQAMESKTVAELAAGVPHATLVFEKLGIDYCCGGKRTLTEACAQAGVAVPDAISALEHSQGTEHSQSVNWLSKSATELTHYILNHFHEPLKDELVALAKLMDKVCTVHGPNHPTLHHLRDLYQSLKDELEPHMMKEEQILFPAILTMDSASAKGAVAGSCFGSIENPIRVMLMEHDSAGETLRKMRATSADYVVPDDACASYRSLLERLVVLERDLHEHIHLENNILFPRAIEMQG